MREIKYRAWDNEKRFMFVPTQIELSQGENFSRWEEWKPMAWRDKLPEEGSGGIGRFIGTECEIMQYTGLKDRNGKEIYEGDILRYLDSYDCSTESGYDFEEFMNAGRVVFDNEKARFDITNKNDIGYYDWIESISDCEVIGNIYEHPHLLEGDSV